MLRIIVAAAVQQNGKSGENKEKKDCQQRDGKQIMQDIVCMRVKSGEPFNLGTNTTYNNCYFSFIFI